MLELKECENVGDVKDYNGHADRLLRSCDSGFSDEISFVVQTSRLHISFNRTFA